MFLEITIKEKTFVSSTFIFFSGTVKEHISQVLFTIFTQYGTLTRPGCHSTSSKVVAVRGDFHIKVTRVMSKILKGKAERYQNPALCVLFEFIFTPKRF